MVRPIVLHRVLAKYPCSCWLGTVEAGCARIRLLYSSTRMAEAWIGCVHRREHCRHLGHTWTSHPLWNGDPVRRFELGKRWMLLAASASATGVGGVGFIVSPRVRHAIDSYNMISPRILRLQLSSGCQLKTIMFFVYSPTSSSDLREADCVLMPLELWPHLFLPCQPGKG